MTEQPTLEGAWERTTSYGRADLTLHPLVREAYKVACLIEMCGGSEALTRASSAAFALTEKLSDFLVEFACQALRDETDAKRMRAALTEIVRKDWHPGVTLVDLQAIARRALE